MNAISAHDAAGISGTFLAIINFPVYLPRIKLLK